MLAIHRRVVVAEGVRVCVCRTELTFSQFTAMVLMFRLKVVVRVWEHLEHDGVLGLASAPPNKQEV